MRKILLTSFLSLVSISCFSQTQIAACENPKGFVYYPYISPVPKDKSGWIEDKITGGKSILVKNPSGLDLIFIDSVKKIPLSSVEDGGKVILLRKTSNQISVLVNYESVTEIYTYWRTDDGRLQFSMIQSKNGMIPGTISKSGLMIGTCQFINFNY
jgi:hypothetical protein